MALKRRVGSATRTEMIQSEYNELGNQRIFLNWTKYHSFISKFAVLNWIHTLIQSEHNELGNQRIFLNWTKYHSFI
jgi:spore coat polysaccharide biosynthesis predicted glycosyltransferase SpsG